MANPFFNAMGGAQGPQGGPMNMMQAFQQFMQQNQGKNPNEMIQQLLSSGKLNQQQLNQAQQMAFQSTPPARGATAKTAKISSCFYINHTIPTNIPSILQLFSKNRVSCSQKTPPTLVRNHKDFLCA